MTAIDGDRSTSLAATGDDLARDVERLSRRVAELERLDLLRRELRRYDEPDTIAARVAEHVTSEGGAARCFVLLDDRGTDGWSVVAAAEGGAAIAPVPEILVERADTLVRRFEGESLVVVDAELAASLEALAAEIVLPLVDASSSPPLVGLLVVAGADAARHRLLEEIGVELAHSVGAAIRNRARAEEMAMLAVQERELVGLLRDVEERDTTIRADLEQAREFQRLMLGSLPRVPRVKIETLFEPLGVVGGDLYAFSDMGDVLRVFIADATGHGIRASLTTMLIKNAYESATHDAEDPATLLGRLNDAIARYKTPEMLFTAVCLDLEPATGRVRLSSAAHPPPFIVRANGVDTLEGGVTALMGLSPGMQFPLVESELGDGESLVLYTDGIVDTHNGEDELFGESGLYATIRAALGRGEDVGRAVLDAIKAFAGKRELTDDATLVGLSRGDYDEPPLSLR